MKALFAKHDLAIASNIRAPPQPVDIQGKFRVTVANLGDVKGIVKLLNRHFEYENSKSKVAVAIHLMGPILMQAERSLMPRQSMLI